MFDMYEMIMSHFFRFDCLKRERVSVSFPCRYYRCSCVATSVYLSNQYIKIVLVILM
jgi:hypothetical protein